MNQIQITEHKKIQIQTFYSKKCFIMFPIQYNNKKKNFTIFFGFILPCIKIKKKKQRQQQTNSRDLAIVVCYYRLHADFISNSSLHFLNQSCDPYEIDVHEVFRQKLYYLIFQILSKYILQLIFLFFVFVFFVGNHRS